MCQVWMDVASVIRSSWLTSLRFGVAVWWTTILVGRASSTVTASDGFRAPHASHGRMSGDAIVGGVASDGGAGAVAAGGAGSVEVAADVSRMWALLWQPWVH